MIKNSDILDALHEQLKEQGHISLSASGRSMGGRIEEAECLFIESTERHTPRIGDVVVAVHHDQWKIHRLLYKSRRKDMWLTMGDTMHSLDRPHSKAQDIIGVVTAISLQGKTTTITGTRHRIIHLLTVVRSILRLVRTRLHRGKQQPTLLYPDR